MKTFAVVGALGLVATLLTTNMTQSDENPISELQTLSVPEYVISFERGSYSIVEANYDSKYQLSDKELISILRDAGFEGDALKYAWAIVVKESTKRPMALNKPTNCYGLFQINMTGSMGPARREKYGLKYNEDLYNPLINAQIAYHMSNGGKNWSAWSTENSAKSIISDFPG
jgi:hypothetical protein